MLRNNIKKLLKTSQFMHYYISLVLVSSIILPTYLERYAGFVLSCPVCLALRAVQIVLLGLSLGVSLVPTHKRIIYPIQLGMSGLGFLLSARQFYFEQFGVRLAGCGRMGSNVFKTVFNWISAGAPVCQRTPYLGHFTLAAWAFVLFGLLSLSFISIYLQKGKSKSSRF